MKGNWKRKISTHIKKANTTFNDQAFRLEWDRTDEIQNYGNLSEHIFTIDKDYGDFIDGRASPTDIQQGEAGDCWFQSSLCSFTNYTNKWLDENDQDIKENYNLFQRVLQGQWWRLVVI